MTRNHGCDACTGQQPCTSCGGNIETEDPAYQALGWALRTLDPEAPAHWQVASIGHSYQSAPARDDSPAWGAIAGMIANAADSLTFAEQGTNASAAALRLAASQTFLPLTGKWGGRFYEVLRGVGTRDRVWSEDVVRAGGVCCPTLICPIPTPTYGTKGQPPGMVLFHEVEVLAIYSNVPPCSCNCCLFRQYIETKITGTGLGPDKKPLPFAPPGQEDAAKDKSKFDHPQRGVPPTPSCTGWTEKKSCESRDLGALSERARAVLDAELARLNLQSFCIYYMRDYPGVLLGPGDSKERTDCFTGVIKTRCPPCSEVKKESFALTVGGSMSQAGGLRESLPSDGGKRFRPGGSCNIPAIATPDC